MRSPAVAAAAVGAVALAAIGLIVSRPDVVALAVPLALWALLAARPQPGAADEPVRVRALPDQTDGTLVDEIVVDVPSEMVELEVVQSARRTRRATRAPWNRRASRAAPSIAMRRPSAGSGGRSCRAARSHRHSAR
jgi:hypothetical protein